MAAKKASSTLKRQFTTRMLIVLIIILSCSSVFQYVYLSKKIESDVALEANKVSESIEQGINETDVASKAIELQLDLKLKIIAQRINDRLGDKPLEEVTNEELLSLSKEFGVAGITLLQDMDKDHGITGVKSTQPSDIGFSFKQFLGEDSYGYQTLNSLYHGKKIDGTFETYIDKNTYMLPIAPSGSNNKKPTFFKYGYYKPDDKDYIINPFLEANEVYHFTQEVGPNNWIKKVLDSNKNVKEIAVLTPKVYADPSLVKAKTETWKKVDYGNFKLETQKDRDTLVKLAKGPKRVAYISKQGGKTFYKVFIPVTDGKVIYVGLDYDLLSKPLKSMSLILLIFSLLSLLALFILSTSFFSNIYKNIQAIISQINLLEAGDFTARSTVIDKGELRDLSASINHMAETLSHVLKDTTKQAEKVQSLALTLKAETDDSVEKVYELSIDLTSNAREDNFDIADFLDLVEEKLNMVEQTEDINNLIQRVKHIRDLSDNRSESTTDITITMSDLIKSLQAQSVELSKISSTLFKNMYKFKL
ncbi:methyl-accepting chemotaxis protein [Neobacillus sp. 114]|uniref:methyl-accepting chemotaxis protein n=1 Tax=Neobacillus sp. 114 TaxID=3048535 RepID=UPI0024C34AA0|nr:methyl-accepting chemotaxis protein [Neobacillus sp. 114]